MSAKRSATSPASLPSPASPSSPSGIHTVSTVCPSVSAMRYRTVPSCDTNLFSIRGSPSEMPLASSLLRSSCDQVEIIPIDSTRCR